MGLKRGAIGSTLEEHREPREQIENMLGTKEK
jgi:hypothetical protein